MGVHRQWNAFSIGDPTYAVNTPGFLMDNVNINTASAGSAALALYFYRAQELRLDNLYLNGNGGTGQTGITLDGTGNYSGGTFIDVQTSQCRNRMATHWPPLRLRLRRLRQRQHLHSSTR